MCPLGGDATTVEQHHRVGDGDRAGPMGDHDRRATVHHGLHRVADLVFLRRVDGARRVVEHEDPRVGHDRPGDRDPLALPARQRVPAFADQRVVSLRQLHHEVVGAGQSRRGFDAPAVGGRIGERDVGGDRVVEQQRVLEHHPDSAPHVVHRDVAHVDAVDLDGALLGVVEAQEQPGDRGLPRARLADERGGLAGCQLQGEVIEHRPARVVTGGVAERHVAERDRAERCGVGQGDRLRRVADVGDRPEHLVDAFEGGRRTLSPRERHPDRPQRPHEQRDVEVEGDELTDGHLIVEHAMAADAQHRDQPERREQVDGREIARPHACRLHRDALDVVGLGSQLVGLHLLGAETLDHPHAGDRLLDNGGELRLLGLHRQHRRVDRRREPLGGDVDERERRQRHERQQRIGEEQDHHDARHEGEVRDRERDHHDERLHLVEIARRAAHQLTGLSPVVVPDVQPEDVVEQALAQPGFGQPALAERDVAAQRGEHPGHQPGATDQHRPDDDRATAFDAAVDRVTGELRDGDLADGPDQASGDADREASALVGQHLEQVLPRVPASIVSLVHTTS